VAIQDLNLLQNRFDQLASNQAMRHGLAACRDRYASPLRSFAREKFRRSIPELDGCPTAIRLVLFKPILG